jgi:hypothetical protein
MREFISEDDLSRFEGWLKSQAIDAATAKPEELENWRSLFDEVRESATAIPKVGLMKLRPLVPDEHRYAVAVREGSDLWLTLWVRRSPKGEFFVFMPRGDRGYHRDGTLHQKSFDHKFGSQKRQCLTGEFRGTEHLGAYMGHGPKSVGAICDPTAFSGVVEVAPSVLGPRDGQVVGPRTTKLRASILAQRGSARSFSRRCSTRCRQNRHVTTRRTNVEQRRARRS